MLWNMLNDLAEAIRRWTEKMARRVKMEMLSDLRLLSCIWLMFLCHLLVVLPLFADFVWTLSEISLICMFLFSGIAGLKPFRAMVWTHPLVIFPGNVLARHNKKRVWKVNGYIRRAVTFRARPRYNLWFLMYSGKLHDGMCLEWCRGRLRMFLRRTTFAEMCFWRWSFCGNRLEFVLPRMTFVLYNNTSKPLISMVLHVNFRDVHNHLWSRSSWTRAATLCLH